ncbi:MAG: LysR family transcriptional regulator [Syntrophaceae bacterium]|nr:LysR family transcriptional regulator [Syntrophaceae bacterium]
MYIKQMEYIVKIAEEGSITKAAEQLYITQSALDQQLLKLEKELGLQLFQRVKNGFTLTEAGKVYLSYARKIINLKKEAYLIIDEIAHKYAGTLKIGLTPERGIEMFIKVYPEFYKSYPDMTIIPHEFPVKVQMEMIASDMLDIGFVTLSSLPKGGYEFIPIKQENFVLAIPISHRYARLANPPGVPYATIDLSLFKDDVFVFIFKESTQRSIIDPLFEKAGYKPKVILETNSNQTSYSMVQNGLSCSFLPDYYAYPDDNVACFNLPDTPPWKLFATYKKGRYIGSAANDFIKLATNYWINRRASDK